ncbi:hypothetical protein Purlil1_14193 [Purpureocillium lilacinum]|uniref:Uncharacterized protein n=1 Tax=Purpureocillium lilacinum TaxID=33203 RepID=A0ABR0BBY7_PURLI|nr:hypothetical protein Purlil1_14193 [Purpureocillium lilacinum]
MSWPAIGQGLALPPLSENLWRPRTRRVGIAHGHAHPFRCGRRQPSKYLERIDMLPAGVLLVFLALGHSMPHEMLTLTSDGTFRDPPAITFSRIDTSDCASVVQDCGDCKDAYHAFRIPDRRNMADRFAPRPPLGHYYCRKSVANER